ncbi:MAG: hypothetical protein KDD15_13870 [Lewinella sp.]|nr:hypothetical protein [Lewinella sp.]
MKFELFKIIVFASCLFAFNKYPSQPLPDLDASTGKPPVIQSHSKKVNSHLDTYIY